MKDNYYFLVDKSVKLTKTIVFALALIWCVFHFDCDLKMLFDVLEYITNIYLFAYNVLFIVWEFYLVPLHSNF